ncbi:hypothetical protein DMP23_21225 [Amycolatopsis sp. A1MSW2902]
MLACVAVPITRDNSQKVSAVAKQRPGQKYGLGPVGFEHLMENHGVEWCLASFPQLLEVFSGANEGDRLLRRALREMLLFRRVGVGAADKNPPGTRALCVR